MIYLLSEFLSLLMLIFKSVNCIIILKKSFKNKIKKNKKSLFQNINKKFKNKKSEEN